MATVGKVKTVRNPPEPRCYVCGCTEMRACNPPCSWDDEESNRKTSPGPICSTCAAMIPVLVEFSEASNASGAGLLRLYKRAQEIALVQVVARAKRKTA